MSPLQSCLCLDLTFPGERSQEAGLVLLKADAALPGNGESPGRGGRGGVVNPSLSRDS